MTNYLIPISAYVITMICFFIRGVYVPKNRRFIVSPDNSDWFMVIAIFMCIFLLWVLIAWFVIYIVTLIL